MKVKCALVQMNYSTDVAENVATAAEHVREAGRGARCRLPSYDDAVLLHWHESQFMVRRARPANRAAARDADAYVVFPFYEKVQEGSCTTPRPSSTAAASPSGCTART